jgi:two-component system, sensor histidine kinase PdtaS
MRKIVAVNHRYLIGLLILWPIFIQAQDLDSLRVLIKKARVVSDEKLYVHLDYLGKGFFQANLYDSAKQCYWEVLNYNLRKGNDSLAGKNFNDLGVMYYKTGEWDSSIYYYQKGLETYREFKDPITLAAMMLNLSIIYKDQGLYDKALELALRAARILEKLEPQIVLGSCYNSIGNIYYKLKNFNYALSFHRKALSIRKTLRDNRSIAQSYNNIANLYKEFKKYDSALFYFSESLEMKMEMKDFNSASSTLNNLGDVSLALNNLPSAERYYKESLKIKKEYNNREGECITLNNLGRLYIRTGFYEDAKQHLNEASRIAKSLQMLEELKLNFELRVQLLKIIGPHEKLVLYMDSLLIVKDSLLAKNKAETLAELQARYETDKKEQQIVQLEKDRELQNIQVEYSRLWMIVSVCGALLLLVIVLLVYNQYRISVKAKRKVELLLQELHHRVKNNLQILSSVLSLQSLELKDESAIKAVKSNEGRVNAMALIHRKLYGSGGERSINIKEYVEELVSYLVHSYGYFGKEFKLDFTLQAINLDIDKAIPVGLVLNEIISNSFKYAFDYHPNPELKVDLSLSGTKELRIVIKDNGKGLPIEPDRIGESTSFGLKMVKMLMAEMKGKWEIKSLEGTTFELIIPLS